jgi:hypothetical protein
VACATPCSWDGDGVGNGEEATDVEDDEVAVLVPG